MPKFHRAIRAASKQAQMQRAFCRMQQNTPSCIMSAQLTFCLGGQIQKRNPSLLTWCIRDTGSVPAQMSTRRCSSNPPSSHDKARDTSTGSSSILLFIFFLSAILVMENLYSHNVSIFQVLVARTQNVKEAEAINTSERQSAGFHPSVWGDYFLECASTDLKVRKDPLLLSYAEGS